MGFENKTMVIIMMALYIAAVSYIGYKNKKSNNSEDYFLASRNLPSWLLSITFIASWWGGGSAIDLVDQANRDGISTFWIYGVPVLLSTFLMYLIAGTIRRTGALSQPQMIEKRYDHRSAFMLSLFIIVFMVIGAAVQIIVVGNLFQSFFGLNYELSATIGTLLVLFYSMFGGFRGVVLTDLLQFVFFLFSSIFLFVLCLNQSGGFEAMSETATAIGREGFTSFMHNIDDNIAYVITFGASWMVQANVWQRISAAKNPASAKKMMAISFFAFIPLYLMVTLTGMLSIATYNSVPDGGVVAAILSTLENPILGAVIFVGLCSAIMSTLDSMLNTGALSMTVDLYKRYISPNQNGQDYVKIGRISTIIIALIALFMALKIKSVLTVSWIGADFIASGAFVPIIAAFLWKRATAIAAFTSMVFGFLFSTYNLCVALGANLPTPWKIASTEQAIVGITLSLVIFITTSLASQPQSK